MAQIVAFPLAARTATPTAVVIGTNRVRAIRVVFDVTAVTSTPSTTIQIDILDSLSGKAVNLLTSVAVATAITTVMVVGPAVTAAANVAASTFLGDSVRISPIHGNANSMTYSVSVHTIK